MKISVDRSDQDRRRDKEIACRHAHIDQRQLRGTVDTVEVDVLHAHQGHAHKDQRREQRKPGGACVAGQGIDALEMVLVGH